MTYDQIGAVLKAKGVTDDPVGYSVWENAKDGNGGLIGPGVKFVDRNSVYIGKGSVVRGDKTILGPGVIIDGDSMVFDSPIGAGSQVLGRSQVGNSIVKANARIVNSQVSTSTIESNQKEQTEIVDAKAMGSMVGAGAKITDAMVSNKEIEPKEVVNGGYFTGERPHVPEHVRMYKVRVEKDVVPRASEVQTAGGQAPAPSRDRDRS
jgi:NDP-sugar pyrophosphorylase family protein